MPHVIPSISVIILHIKNGVCIRYCVISHDICDVRIPSNQPARRTTPSCTEKKKIPTQPTPSNSYANPIRRPAKAHTNLPSSYRKHPLFGMLTTYLPTQPTPQPPFFPSSLAQRTSPHPTPPQSHPTLATVMTISSIKQKIDRRRYPTLLYSTLPCNVR
jgi:hypothetical protein